MQSDDPEFTSMVLRDYRDARLSPRLRAILDYAVKLTTAPDTMTESDVEGLRQLGLTDEEILSVVLITCLFNFMTRLAHGLGVEASPEREKRIRGWISQAAAEQPWLFHHP
ncbi:MAG: hypothetical protein HY681_00150 [Chloroflexi bacterium]|nr:hypothetical protein [Chloroflexota bacterium]